MLKATASSPPGSSPDLRSASVAACFRRRNWLRDSRPAAHPARSFRLSQRSVEFSARHFQFFRMLANPFGESIQLRRTPAAFELGPVLAGLIQCEVKLILQVRKLGLDDRRGSQRRRNENHAIALGHHQISRQHHGSADAHRDIDSRQFLLSPGRRVIAAVKPIQIRGFAVFLGVPYGARFRFPGWNR
jgi:hypothetical protein